MKTLGNTIANSFSSITLTNGVSFVTITAPPTGIYIISLPPNIGTPGQFLQTDGAGSTSWQTVPAGTVTTVSASVPSFLNVNVLNPTTSPAINITYNPTTPLPVEAGGTGLLAAGLPGSLFTVDILGEPEWKIPGLPGSVLITSPGFEPEWEPPGLNGQGNFVRHYGRAKLSLHSSEIISR